MKRLILILTTASTMLALIPVASADQPTREFLPVDDAVIEGVCPFAVGADILANNSYIKTFSDGRQRINGTLKVRLTNLDEPSNSLDANISGPGVQTVSPEGEFELRARGPWFFFFLPDELGPGKPGFMILTTGLAILRFDAEGNGSFTHKGGTTTDVCAALA